MSALAGTRFYSAFAAESGDIAPQPYFAAVNRALEALAKLGAPVTAADAQQLATLAHQGDRAAIDAAERILDRYTLVRIVTEADGAAPAVVAGASPTLLEQGWRVFLMRVSNPLGTTARLGLRGAGQSIATVSSGASRADFNDTVNP